MDPALCHSEPSIDTTDWKEIAMEYGRYCLTVHVPSDCAILTMREIPVIASPGNAYEAAMDHPIGCPPLKEIIHRKGKSAAELTVAIAISNITRPVPYRGPDGLLQPLLNRLKAAGIARERIAVVIGNGMHHPSTLAQRAEFLDSEILTHYQVIDHDCEDLTSLSYLGPSETGGNVFVNSAFQSADLKIATGLVESHYMAGFSGGRKAICPGLVDKRTIEQFHSPALLESPFAQNLILEGNPCHTEALAVARTVGVDFLMNVTLDRDLRLTGVFAGDIEAAHLAACELVRDYVTIPINQEYDIILTHGGYVGRNHYQAVKAGHNALPAIHSGGIMIVAADNRDEEPIGGIEYKSLLHMLKLQGADHYLKMLQATGWRFTRDQWEPEMWAKIFRKISMDRYFYCTHTIPRSAYNLIPGRCGLDLLEEDADGGSIKAVQEMVERAMHLAVASFLKQGITPRVAFIREGPYAIPCLTSSETATR